MHNKRSNDWLNIEWKREPIYSCCCCCCFYSFYFQFCFVVVENQAVALCASNVFIYFAFNRKLSDEACTVCTHWIGKEKWGTSIEQCCLAANDDSCVKIYKIAKSQLRMIVPMKLEFIRIMKQNRKKNRRQKKREIPSPIRLRSKKTTTTYSTKNGNFSRLNVCVKYQTIIDICRDLKMNKNRCIELLSVRWVSVCPCGFRLFEYTLNMYISLALLIPVCKCALSSWFWIRCGMRFWVKETKYIL